MTRGLPLQRASDNETQIARFVGPTWGPPGTCRPQMGPMLAPWTLLSGKPFHAMGVLCLSVLPYLIMCYMVLVLPISFKYTIVIVDIFQLRYTQDTIFITILSPLSLTLYWKSYLKKIIEGARARCAPSKSALVTYMAKSVLNNFEKHTMMHRYYVIYNDVSYTYITYIQYLRV